MMIIILTAVISSQSGGLTGNYVGPHSIYLPMKHTSCGARCLTHRPAAIPSGLALKYRIGMSCSKGKKVNYLAYQLPGRSLKVLRSGNTGRQKYSITRRINFFSTSELGRICQKKLGGSWRDMGRHRGRDRVVRASAKKYFRIYGRCTGSRSIKKRRSSIKLSLLCGDKRH